MVGIFKTFCTTLETTKYPNIPIKNRNTVLKIFCKFSFKDKSFILYKLIKTPTIYKLIKEGASIVTEPQDIFNYLNWEIEDKTASEKNKTTDFLDNEEKVYKTLSLDPSTLDEIISKTNLSAEEILITLTTLELKGFIQKTGTQQYARTLKK